MDELTINQDETNDGISFAEWVRRNQRIRRIGSTALSNHRSTLRVIAAEREGAS